MSLTKLRQCVHKYPSANHSINKNDVKNIRYFCCRFTTTWNGRFTQGKHIQINNISVASSSSSTPPSRTMSSSSSKVNRWLDLLLLVSINYNHLNDVDDIYCRWRSFLHRTFFPIYSMVLLFSAIVVGSVISILSISWLFSSSNRFCAYSFFFFSLTLILLLL